MESKINYNNRSFFLCFGLMLTMVVFLPSFSKAENQKMPNQFIGNWVEYNNVDQKEVPNGDTLTIKTDSMVWKRTDKFNKGEYNLQYTIIADDGKAINFVTDNSDKLGASSEGDVVMKVKMSVSMTLEGDNIIFETLQNKYAPVGATLGAGLGAGMVSKVSGRSVFKKVTKQ